VIKCINKDSFNGDSLLCGIVKALHKNRADCIKYVSAEAEIRYVYNYSLIDKIIDRLNNNYIEIDKTGEEFRKNKCNRCKHKVFSFCTKKNSLILSKAYKSICPLNKWSNK